MRAYADDLLVVPCLDRRRMYWTTLAVTSGVAIAAVAQTTTLNTNSAISIGILVVIIGAVWKISSILTRVEEQLKRLDKVPERVQALEAHMESLESDISNVFAAIRAHPEGEKILDLTRRARYRPSKDE